MVDLRQYGILEEKERSYENIAYVTALIYNTCERKISRLLSEYGISTAQFNVLVMVKSQNLEDGGLTQVDIGKRLIVSAGGITRLIDKLVSQNFLVVKQNKNNRRENLVTITTKGVELVEAIWPNYDALIKDLTDFIPQKKQQEFANILAEWFIKLQEV